MDGGKTWSRLPINDEQGNKNLEGIGFISEDVGWVGGWGDASFQGGYTSSTEDGGKTWKNATNEVGRFINRFRFFGSPVTVGYASGKTIYKYSTETGPTADDMAALRAAGPTPMLIGSTEVLNVGAPFLIKFVVPEDAKQLRLYIWNQFGSLVRTLLAEENPQTGMRQVSWDGSDDKGNALEDGGFIYRLRVDDRCESRVILLSRQGPS